MMLLNIEAIQILHVWLPKRPDYGFFGICEGRLEIHFLSLVSQSVTPLYLEIQGRWHLFKPHIEDGLLLLTLSRIASFIGQLFNQISFTNISYQDLWAILRRITTKICHHVFCCGHFYSGSGISYHFWFKWGRLYAIGGQNIKHLTI